MSLSEVRSVSGLSLLSAIQPGQLVRAEQKDLSPSIRGGLGGSQLSLSFVSNITARNKLVEDDVANISESVDLS